MWGTWGRGTESEERRKKKTRANRPTENVVRGQLLQKGLQGYRL
jgi:hypothetical protein